MQHVHARPARALVYAILALLALWIPAAATGAPPVAQVQINTLKGQVSLLSTRASLLQSRIAVLEGELRAAESAAETASRAARAADGVVSGLTRRIERNEDTITCYHVVGNDIDVSFYNVLSFIIGSPARITTRMDDRGACDRVGYTRSSFLRAGPAMPAFDALGALLRFPVAPPLR